MLIRVIDYTDDEYAFEYYPELWNKIRGPLADGHQVVFDFVGIERVGSDFLRIITKPLMFLSFEEYSNQVRFKRMGHDIINRVICSRIKDALELENSITRNLTYTKHILSYY